MHTVAVSTCSYVSRVEKNTGATPQQAPKSVAKTESSHYDLPSCGIL